MGSVSVATVPDSTFFRVASQVFSVYRSGSLRALGLLTALLVPAAILLSRSAHLFGLGQLVSVLPAVCLMGGCIAYIHWRPLPKLVVSAHLMLLTILLTNFLSVMVQVAGRSPYPLVDPQLAALDASVHFHTVDFVHFVSAWPALRVGFSLAYMSVTLSLIISIILPPLLGRAERSYRFMLAVFVALMFTVLIFYRWPAVGPWTVEGYTPGPSQAAVATYLRHLRSNTPLLIDMNDAGIVSFPSFHVVLAILSGYALNPVRGVRWIAWILCILTCISTITTGWHYGVDVIGGAAVAAVSLAVAIWMVPQS